MLLNGKIWVSHWMVQLEDICTCVNASHCQLVDQSQVPKDVDHQAWTIYMLNSIPLRGNIPSVTTNRWTETWVFKGVKEEHISKTSIRQSGRNHRDVVPAMEIVAVVFGIKHFTELTLQPSSILKTRRWSPVPACHKNTIPSDQNKYHRKIQPVNDFAWSPDNTILVLLLKQLV